VAQGILESGAGTSNFAINRNNFFGIGAYDRNPDLAFWYDTPEAGWEGYYKNIQKTATYRNHGVFQGDTVTNPHIYIIAVKEAGYATDPNYVNKVSKIIASIEAISTERGWASSAQLASTHPEMLTNAAANAEGASLASANTSSMYVDCVSNGGTFVSVDGFVFPLLGATKSNISGGRGSYSFLSNIPCNNPAGCHYGPSNDPAFDICFKDSSKCIGAKVLAIADGKVTRVTYTRNGVSCNAVRYQAFRNGELIGLFLYLHIAGDQSIVSGQEFKAGDIIGEVSGVGPCHDNSTPHLHLDLNRDRTATGGPSGPSSRDPALVPIINSTYYALPDS
jgi:murein DD-endopeptidase MepM/ murein hydrolase activator NlpD